MEPQSPPICRAVQMILEEEALKASDIHAQGIMVTIKEAVRDDKFRILCDGCTSRPFYLYQFSQIIAAFHILWPLVLYGCGCLEPSALPTNVLWTTPIWSGTLSSLAYIIWVSMKPYVYFFHTGIEECSDPQSTTHFRGQVRISSHKQVPGLACSLSTSRWAVRIMIWDTWFCTCAIIGIGWERIRFEGSNNRELAFKGASSAIGILLLIVFATMITKSLLVVVERLDGYRKSPQAMKLHSENYKLNRLTDAHLRRSTVNKPRVVEETDHGNSQERGMSPKTVVAENQTLPTQVTSLEAQVAGLQASNTHNEVLAIGLRKRVRTLEHYIDHLLEQPSTFDETRFATARELPERNSQAAQLPKDGSMGQSQEPKTEDLETHQPEKSVANAVSTHDEQSSHQFHAPNADWMMEEGGLRVKPEILLLRQRVAEYAKERALSARPSPTTGVVENFERTPEKALKHAGVDAGNEWEEV